MNRNPFTVRYGYHAARWRAARRKASFCLSLADLPSPADESTPEGLPVEVVCMLGQTGIPEAALTFRSLIRCCGQPERLTLVSDGTLTSEDGELLQRAIPRSQVVSLDEVLAPGLPAAIRERLCDSWMVAKQALLMSLPRESPALFIDSDILFFRCASRLAGDLAELGDRPAYMVDVIPNFDDRLLTPADALTPPLNSGFLYLPRPLDWSGAVDRFAALPRDGGLEFTDQTMSHLAFHNAGGAALEPSAYVLALDDQFDYADRHAHRDGVVCRHYVNTIRHKMWMLA